MTAPFRGVAPGVLALALQQLDLYTARADLMSDADRELALVVKALQSRVGGCVEWIDDRAARRVREDRNNLGLTPEYIKQQVIDHVCAEGASAIEQRPETRPEYGHRRYWYRVLLPEEGFPRGLFVELELTDDRDEDFPVVSLLNAHPQRS
jgi:hypothetical protein